MHGLEWLCTNITSAVGGSICAVRLQFVRFTERVQSEQRAWRTAEQNRLVFELCRISAKTPTPTRIDGFPVDTWRHERATQIVFQASMRWSSAGWKRPTSPSDIAGNFRLRRYFCPPLKRVTTSNQLTAASNMNEHFVLFEKSFQLQISSDLLIFFDLIRNNEPPFLSVFASVRTRAPTFSKTLAQISEWPEWLKPVMLFLSDNWAHWVFWDSLKNWPYLWIIGYITVLLTMSIYAQLVENRNRFPVY